MVGSTKIHRRRDTDPVTVQRVWEAIEFIKGQKQVANFDRICRYMRRHVLGEEAVSILLDHAVTEHLITRYDSKSGKLPGAPEQDGFLVPKLKDADSVRDGHDWYCFECHRPGDIVDCSQCWRAFHSGCLESCGTAGNKALVCDHCKIIADVTKESSEIKPVKLNRLLSYTTVRLKEESDDLFRLGTEQQIDELKRQLFMYRYLDLNLLEENVKKKHYTSLEQYRADVEIIQHNVLVCFGRTGHMADLANQMLVDCDYDLKEIRRCKDCYYFSNVKPDDWFTKPCRPKHQLVFAKQKGYCYWPAKVLGITDKEYDVRFFGGHHERATVPLHLIKPVESSRKDLELKQSSSLTAALSEVSRHERLLTSNFVWPDNEDDEDGYDPKLANTSPKKLNLNPIVSLIRANSEELLAAGVRSNKRRWSQTEDKSKRHSPELSSRKLSSRNEKKRKSLCSGSEDKGNLRSMTPQGNSSQISSNKNRKSISPKPKKSSSKSRPKRASQDEAKEEEHEKPRVKRASTATCRSSNIRKKAFKLGHHHQHIGHSSQDNDGSNSDSESEPKLMHEHKKRRSESAVHATGNKKHHISRHSLSAASSTKVNHRIVNRAIQTSYVQTADAQTSTIDSDPELQLTSCHCNVDKKLREFVAITEERLQNEKAVAIQILISNMTADAEKATRRAVAMVEEGCRAEMDRKLAESERLCKEECQHVMEQLKTEHIAELSQVKKKQWCVLCDEEAIYHCCWNTSYCTTTCQQDNWHEHKKTCRRKKKNEGH